MSLSKYATPLALNRHPSKRFAIYLIAAHSLALVVLCLPMALPWYGRLILGFAVLFSLVYTLMGVAWLRFPSSVVSLHWDHNDVWTLTNATGITVQARLLADTLVTSKLVILRFACDDGRRRVVPLLWDGVNGDSLRRLRVRLRQSVHQT